MFLAVLLIPFAIPSVFAHSECAYDLSFGKICPQNKTSTKWFFDSKLAFCYPYEFLGCEQGQNSFDTQDHCLESCKPADQFSCGGNTDPDGVCFSPQDKTCKPGTVCVMGGTIGFCCDKSVQDQWNKEHSPKCLTGNTVQIDMWFGKTALIGRSCSHNFCPTGSKCIQGKWTAYCCQ